MPNSATTSDSFEYYTEAEVENLCHISNRKLRDWRYRSTGPRPTRVGRTVIYNKALVHAYLLESTASADSWR